MSVQLEQLSKRFGRTEVIHEVDLTIPDGELTVFVGPSGCGKSTLLRLIAGLEEASAGRIRIAGNDVTDLPPARRGVAMVFQSYALYPHMSVFENMAFGLKLAKRSRAEIVERVHAAARTLQIEPLLDKRPRELSGGQRQRVAIGRAIVREPKVFLFDEPLSNLDAALRVQMRLELAQLQRELSATMVYVTHDQVEAMTLGHRIVVLNAGRVEQVGTPLTLYERPANRFVAGFIGSPQMNFLAVKRWHADGIDIGETFRIPVTPSAAESRPVTVGIRPEHLRIEREGLPGSVSLIERLGSETYLYLDTPAGPLNVRTAGDSRYASGDRLRIALPPEHVHLFDRDGRTV